MDKNAVKKFAVWARLELIERVSQKARQYGITADEVVDANADSIHGRVLSREEKRRRQKLVREVKAKGYEQTMEEAAYTWFNRFIALRFMEVNGYLPSHVRVFTDGDNNFKPQILTEAINLDLDGLDMEKVYELKNANKTEELYKYLLLTQCNALGAILPGMFQSIDDYMELLFPDNLLREGSVVDRMITEIDQNDWKDQVQIIGWLYQYYNTELNDLVYDGNMSKSRITKDLLPPATTIYTPDWAVHYMVDNSLGRLWLEGHPDDKVRTELKYYLDDVEQEPEVATKLSEIRKGYATMSPEDIKCIDPCMGSGHILVYMFDVLMQIYESQGYSRRDAVSLILQKNLYGLDIDDRAAQLAYFAVMMTAVKYDKRLLTRKDELGKSAVPQPHVYAIPESNWIGGVFPHDMGSFLLDKEYQETLNYLITAFEDAKEYGSILQLEQRDYEGFLQAWKLTASQTAENIGLILWYDAVRDAIPQLAQVAMALTQQYDVVVTNPPYLGSSRFSPKLDAYVKKNYSNDKADLSMVMYSRAVFSLRKQHGFVSFITTSTWMFLSSFEKLRINLGDTVSLSSLTDYGTELFDGKVGHNPIVSWVAREYIQGLKFTAIRLVDYCYARRDEKEPEFFETRNRYVCNQDNFSKIPGSPMAYWVSDNFVHIFTTTPHIGDIAFPKQGLHTGDNDKYLRLWHEVDIGGIALIESEVWCDDYSWAPLNKGGAFRKWYGNREYVILWKDNGLAIKTNGKSVGASNKTFFHNMIGFTDITSYKPSFRLYGKGFVYDVSGPSMFNDEKEISNLYLMGLLNSKICDEVMSILSPTIHMNQTALSRTSIRQVQRDLQAKIEGLVSDCIRCSVKDWNSFETSWDFQYHPIVRKADSRSHWGAEGDETIEYVYRYVAQDMEERFQQLHSNEEELNRIFIDIYGLQDELTPEVEDKDVTVRRPDLQRDIKSLISYAVGCMFGRYSLDTPGLAYAGGQWDNSKYNRFQPDRDNIIPITDDEYFEDDIVARFIRWVEVVFGKSTLEENLKFIADALGGTGAPRDVIRSYFLNDFYADHLKTYQKRPIYWLFDSGKKGGFKALIYMHRYQPDTIARMRTDYVHEQQSRYRTAIADVERRMKDASTSEQVKLKKRLAKLQAQDGELLGYEEKIHHLADQMIRIDLDDGVKVNYAKFQDVLAPIK